jgi:hypothetical protein
VHGEIFSFLSENKGRWGEEVDGGRGGGGRERRWREREEGEEVERERGGREGKEGWRRGRRWRKGDFNLPKKGKVELVDVSTPLTAGFYLNSVFGAATGIDTTPRR